MLATEEIREQFPALERRHNGQPVAYFDGAGGTQVPRAVVEAVDDYLYHHNANTHWAYPTSAETDTIIESGREALADFLNASPAEIAFGANTTTNIYHLSRALGRSLGPGDEVVITELEHHANVAPWQALVVERGVTLKIARMVPETGGLDWDDLERSITKRTKVVAITAASNALGTVNDFRAAVDIAHASGALALVDAVHYAPYFLCDVRQMDCDFLTCSAYKFYGPHVAVFYGRRDLLESVDFPKLEPAPDTAPERVEMGTQSHEGIAGAAAAVDFYSSLAGYRNARGGSATGSARIQPGSPARQPRWGGRAGGPPASLPASSRSMPGGPVTQSLGGAAPGMAGKDAGEPLPGRPALRREFLVAAFETLHKRSSAQVARLWESLSQIKGVRLYGPLPEVERTPTVSFIIEGRASTQVARSLAERGLFVSHGDFYAATVIERLGLAPEGLVRIGSACYTSDGEIERLISAVREIARTS